MNLVTKILLPMMFFTIILNAEERTLKIEDMKKEARVALVIGNATYDGDKLNKLKNPTNDAKSMKDILTKKGFEVIYQENATHEEMDRSVNNFLSKLKSKNAIGMFYYAGHGIEVKGENYLIPIGAKISDEISVKHNALAVNSVVDGMKESKNRLNIVVLDACRNNPFAVTRGGKGGLSEISDADGMFIAYATDKGKTAEDGDGKNGLFTSYMLKYMDMEGLKIEELFKLVRKDVKNSSNSTQIPWTLNSLYGDFYFTLPKVQNTQVATQSVSQVVKPVVVQEVVKPIIPKEVVVIDGLWYQNQPFTKEYIREDAKAYCNNLTLGGASDWRLPQKEELNKISNIKMYGVYDDNWEKWFENNKDKRIKNSKGYEHFIRKEFSENMPEYPWFWSVTENNINSSSAWFVNFYDGHDSRSNKSNEHYALCVRGQ